MLGLTNCWTFREEEREVGFLEQLVSEDVQRLREMIELQIGRYSATVNQAAAAVDAEALSVGDRERLLDWARKQDRASGDLVGSAIEPMARRPFDRWYVLDASGTMRAIFPPKGVEGIDFFERDSTPGASPPGRDKGRCLSRMLWYRGRTADDEPRI